MKEITNLKTKARRLVIADLAVSRYTTLKEAKNYWKGRSASWKRHDIRFAKNRILAEERRARK
jgi:hypothetical protein